jgi:WD40 repeat protein
MVLASTNKCLAQSNKSRKGDAATKKRSCLSGRKQEAFYSAAFSPDGSRIVTASGDKTARIWDAASAKEIAVVRHDRPVHCAAFSRDGSRIVTAGGGAVRVWGAATAKEIAVLRGHGGDSLIEPISGIPLSDFMRSAAFSRDGSRIVTASWDRTARIWDVTTTKEIAAMTMQ